jgi:hypothetical protein
LFCKKCWCHNMWNKIIRLLQKLNKTLNLFYFSPCVPSIFALMKFLAFNSILAQLILFQKAFRIFLYWDFLLFLPMMVLFVYLLITQFVDTNAHKDPTAGLTNMFTQIHIALFECFNASYPQLHFLPNSFGCYSFHLSG